MPESFNVLLFAPPINPVLRPIDVIYTHLKRSKNTVSSLPLQLGLLSIASYLREEGFSCQYYDLCHFEGNSTLRESISNQLKKFNPAIVGFTSYTANFNATLKAIDIIKEIDPNILVCVGGSHVTFLDKYSIEESNFKIDVVVRGEGERTMRDIVHYYLKGVSLEENVRGITTKKKKTPDQELLSNEELNNLPPMAFDLIPKKEREKIIYIPLNASRGCSYNCTFCTNPIFWQHNIRFRAPEKVIEEILLAEELFPNRMIEFTDTILPFRLNHFEKLVYQYTNSVHTPITMALTRANLTDNKRLQLMKTLLQEEGYLIIGVENGNSRILELMEKPTWEEQFTALKKIKEFNITSIPSWMVGFCGENLYTINENLNKLNYLYKEALITSIILFIWIPIPGSLPFQNPKKYGVKIHTYNWDYYDRAVFPPPYSLYNPDTGELTLSNLQIWAYYLSMLSLQKLWSQKRDLLKGKSISFTEFIKKIPQNQKSLYISPAGDSNMIIYKDLLEQSFI